MTVTYTVLNHTVVLLYFCFDSVLLFRPLASSLLQSFFLYLLYNTLPRFVLLCPCFAVQHFLFSLMATTTVVTSTAVLTVLLFFICIRRCPELRCTLCCINNRHAVLLISRNIVRIQVFKSMAWLMLATRTNERMMYEKQRQNITHDNDIWSLPFPCSQSCYTIVEYSQNRTECT